MPVNFLNQDRRFGIIPQSERKFSGSTNQYIITDEDADEDVAVVYESGPSPKADAVLLAHAPPMHLLCKQSEDLLHRILQEGLVNDPLYSEAERLHERLTQLLSDIEVESHG